MKLEKMRKEFINSLLEYSKVNEVPYLLTGDFVYSVLEPYQELHPEKFINVGIMEQSMMSIAAGFCSKAVYSSLIWTNNLNFMQ